MSPRISANALVGLLLLWGAPTSGCQGGGLEPALSVSSKVEITISADNAWFMWVDGQPYSGPSAASWQHSDTFQLHLPAGEHVVSVYVEDWGGYAYLVATIRVDGELIGATGDGSWRTSGTQWTDSLSRDSTARGLRWPQTPANGSWGLEVPPPHDWTSGSFDDGAWPDVSICDHDRLPGYADITAARWDDFDPLCRDGAQFVFTSHDCYPRGERVLPDGTLKTHWSVGLFRGRFNF